MAVALPEKTVTKVDSEAAVRVANVFLITHVGDCCCAGEPRRMLFAVRPVWMVPVLLSYPRAGPIGELGTLAVDEELGTVVGHTLFEEMKEKARQLLSQQKQSCPQEGL